MRHITNHYAPRPLRKLAFVIACVAFLPMMGCGSGEMSQPESDAYESLRTLGAIISKDASNIHPATVNMIGLKSEDSLDEAIELIGKLPYVTHLELTDMAFSDTHAQTIAGLKNINSLVLTGTQITDSGVDTLTSLKKLEALYIDRTSITPIAMDAIGGFKNMQILEISQCDVLSNLAPLSQLPKLEWLLIKDSTIDAQTMAVIQDLPALRRFSIEGSTVAPKDLAALKKAKPSLAIDMSGGDADGGGDYDEAASAEPAN